MAIEAGKEHLVGDASKIWLNEARDYYVWEDERGRKRIKSEKEFSSEQTWKKSHAGLATFIADKN